MDQNAIRIFVAKADNPAIGLRAGNRIWVNTKRKPEEGDRLICQTAGGHLYGNYVEEGGRRYFEAIDTGERTSLEAMDLIGPVDAVQLTSRRQ